MDRQQFISYIHEPTLLDKGSLQEIEELAKEFPYCQSLNILYLLNLRMTNLVLYENQLKTTAAHIADRKKLKELIRITSNEQGISNKEVKVEVNTDSKPETSDQKPVTSDQKPVTSDQKPETSDQKPETSNQKPETSDQKPETSNQKPETSDQKPVTSDQKPVTSNQEPETHDPPIVPIIEEDEEMRLLALKQIVEDRLKEISDRKHGILEDEQEEETLSKEELIEKFIKEEPSISRPKTDFFDPVKVAKNSMEEKDGLVSETLARIHIQQGNIAKAIEIYRKLSLNFPEKSGYFAAQIKKVSTDN